MKQLWVGRRFQLNERGHYEASSKSQGERVSVEIDANFIDPQAGDPETLLLKMHVEAAIRGRSSVVVWALGPARATRYSSVSSQPGTESTRRVRPTREGAFCQ